jgi:hypothetical protein
MYEERRRLFRRPATSEVCRLTCDQENQMPRDARSRVQDVPLEIVPQLEEHLESVNFSIHYSLFPR